MSDNTQEYKDIFSGIQNETIKSEYSKTMAVKSSIANETQKTKYIVNSNKDIIAPGTVWEDIIGSADVIQTFALNTLDSVRKYGKVAAEKTQSLLDTGAEIVLKAGTTAADTLYSILFDKSAEWVSSVMDSFAGGAQNVLKNIPASTPLGKALVNVGLAFADNLRTYQDGVTETTFGSRMEDSWAGLNDSNNISFLNYFAKQEGTYRVKIMNSTPLDPGEARKGIFGSLIMGTPFLYNSQADPGNRAFINSIVKDGRYVSFIPGKPKYNGMEYVQGEDNIYKQTRTPNEQLDFLLRNGLDSYFSKKDKRYYTFEAQYGEYFAYLEAMLNPIWIKMGLANSNDPNEFNIMSFFEIKSKNGDGIDPNNSKLPLERYQSPIGFFCDPSGAVSESIDGSTTSFGQELSGQTNSNSDEYQRINYITGMGTGSSVQNASRKIATAITGGKQIASLIGENFTGGFTGAKKGWDMASSKLTGAKKYIAGTVGGIAGFAAGVASDVVRISSSKDLGAMIQSIGTANGMKVMYPELWSNSTYSKNINLNFTFMSPYGDPLSIFKYVYVPFCSLLTLAMPRQAAENAYVSPFFVRADIPGLITSDLALISSISWVKGTGNNLWTKDGLPRGIDVNITITDLYPYLSMTKRFSYLSANPSYTVFLDSMAGLCVLQKEGEDPLNEYFNALLNRVSTDNSQQGLWNQFYSDKQTSILNSFNKERNPLSSKINVKNIPWMG